MSIFKELRRRNVFRVAAAYLIGTWLVVQIADLVLDNIDAPDWVIQVLFLLLAIGFIAALIISWAYEVTPEGIKRERDVIRDESITHLTGKKLDYITLAAAAGVAFMFGWQQLTYVQPPSSQDVDGEPSTSDTKVATAKLGSQSIAVLPFANRSNQEQDLFFTDGIHDDLLTQLAKISDLKVISRTSVMGYRGTTKQIPQIASELGVAKVLEGGVQRAGQRIRINAQLIDVATDEHLWAETFDREMTIDNLFDIQSEITRQIVAAIKGELSATDQGTLASAPTESVPAYEAYIRARHLLASSGYNLEKFQKAQPLFEQAVALDPAFALAQLGLAEVHGYARWIGYGDGSAHQAAAQLAIERATEVLGADAPEVIAARGSYLYRFERDYAGSLEAATEAAKFMPGNVDLLNNIGASQRRLGLFDEAIASYLLADELDPASHFAPSLVAETMFYNAEFDRLLEYLASARKRLPYDTDLGALEAWTHLTYKGDAVKARQTLDNVRPNSGLHYVLLSIELPWYERDFEAAIAVWDQPEVMALAATAGWSGRRELYEGIAWLHLGDEDRANMLFKQVINFEINPEFRGNARALELNTKSWAYALLADAERAIAASKEAMDLVRIEDDKIEGPMSQSSYAYVLARAGRRDELLALLPDVLDAPNGLYRSHVRLDPRWDFFRNDERFNELINPE